MLAPSIVNFTFTQQGMTTDYRRKVIRITLCLPLINNKIVVMINLDAFTFFEPTQGSATIMYAWKEFIVKLLKLGDIFLQVFSNQILNIGLGPILWHCFHHVENIFLKSLNHLVVALVYKLFESLNLLKYLLVENSIFYVGYIPVLTFILESNLFQQRWVSTLFIHPFKMNNVSLRPWQVNQVSIYSHSIYTLLKICFCAGKTTLLSVSLNYFLYGWRNIFVPIISMLCIVENFEFFFGLKYSLF